MASKAIDIITVASDIGSIYAGKSKAPAAFHAAGLQEKLETAGFKVTTYSALTEAASWTASTRDPNGARNELRTVAACAQVSKTISSILEADQQPRFQLLLSGECLYCPAILSAHWRHLRDTSRKVGLIYFDADCDLYTPTEARGTGNIAGMTLTHLTLRAGALDSMKPFSRPDGAGVVDSSNVVLFGLNMDSEANKREHLGYLFDEGFRVVTSRAVQQAPVESAQAALAWLAEQGVEHLLVHLDVDAIDPGEFPLCNVPSWTGLGYGEAMEALKTFLRSDLCVGLSVAEVNPDHDLGLGMTRRLVDDIVDGLGKRKGKGTLPSRERS